ncbi:MAG TPA: hypothetical protein VJJ78_02770 [Candidatus Saccharimonadales bacterium]|nr:hypothetical protein [Candidatus Saccharimonadales bacterium]
MKERGSIPVRYVDELYQLFRQKTVTAVKRRVIQEGLISKNRGRGSYEKEYKKPEFNT